MQRVPGSTFCGVHINNGETGATAAKLPTKERVVCPACSTTVYASKLKSHLRSCPKTRLQRDLEQRPYYSKDANSGRRGAGAEGRAEDESGGGGGGGGVSGGGGGVSSVSGGGGGEMAFDEMAFNERLMVQVEQLYAAHVGSIPLRFTEPAECKQMLASSDASSFRKTKHLTQQASIVGAMKVK